MSSLPSEAKVPGYHEGTVAPDWVTLTSRGGAEAAALALRWCADRWGPGQAQRGFWCYSRAVRFPTGAVVLWENVDCAESVALSLPGEVWSWEGGDVAGFLGDVVETFYGWRCSRCDLAITWECQRRIGMIDEYRRLIELGGLRGGMTWRYIESRRADGRWLGETLYIGSTTSRRFLRIYDKGLEEGLGLKHGRKVRAEGVHRELAAAVLWMALCWRVDPSVGRPQVDLMLPGWEDLGPFDLMRAVVYDLVRLDGVPSESVVQGAGLVVRGNRGAKSLEARRRWLERCVWPAVLGVSAALGGDLSATLEVLGCFGIRRVVGSSDAVVYQAVQVVRSSSA